VDVGKNAHMHTLSCLFYEWCWNLRFCFER